VDIGILIALQIYNWNGEHAKKALMFTNIKSNAEDTQADIHDIQKDNKTLEEQLGAFCLSALSRSFVTTLY
tara:strand:+ start:1158 stop:1370 length:213 start_codon:yes stop_codon:yes gene_type:complete